MNRTQTILRNIFSNWMGFAIQSAVVFFLTPYVLRSLGDTRYGVWILNISIGGSYGLLALGFQGGLNQYLTRYLAKHEFDRMNVVASTATVVLSCVGLTIIIVALGLAWLAPRIFKIPTALETEVFWCILIMGLSVAIQMRLFVFSATLMATQRFDLANIIGVITRLLSAALIVAALKFNWGLIGVSVATAASNIVDFCTRWLIAYRVLPELVVSRRLASWDAFREIFSFSSWSFLATLAQTAFVYVDTMVIGTMMPIAALAPYALASGLVRQLEGFLNPIEHVIFPVVTQLHSRGEFDILRSVYLRGSRIYLVIVAVTSVLAGFWAADFFRLWVGQRFVSGQVFPSVALLFHILLCAMCGRLLPGVGSQVLVGSTRIKSLSLLSIAEATANVLLTILLVRSYGLVGVALATLASVLVLRSLAIPLLLRQQLGVPLSEYFRQTTLRPLAVAALLSLAAMFIRSLGEVQSFLILFLQGAVAVLVALPLGIVIGLTHNDRQQFIFRPLQAIITRNSLNRNVPPPASHEFTEQCCKRD